jgi:hypothetical protein
VASCFNIPSGATGVLYSRTGEWEFQLWTPKSEPLVIIKVTTSEPREQAELAHHGVQKICSTKKREELDQDLQSQTGAHLQKTNLEVMYNHGMVHNLSISSRPPLADFYAVFDDQWL